MNVEVTKVAGFSEIWNCRSTAEKSLHALLSYQQGDLICSFGDKETLTEPSYLTVQVREREHILLEPEFLQYINHSCDPNVFFDTDNRIIVCLKDIKRGDEITFFYPSTEWSMEREFQCRCGATGCLGLIRGALHVEREILQGYRVTKFIQQKSDERDSIHPLTAPSDNPRTR